MSVNKINLNETVKPKLNKNFSLPWTPHGEKGSENHQILLSRGKATSLISGQYISLTPGPWTTPMDLVHGLLEWTTHGLP